MTKLNHEKRSRTLKVITSFDHIDSADRQGKRDIRLNDSYTAEQIKHIIKLANRLGDIKILNKYNIKTKADASKVIEILGSKIKQKEGIAG